MKKSVAFLLVFVFVTASCLMWANPVFSQSLVPAENTWVSKAPLPQGKSSGLVTVNGKIYAIGGTIYNYVSGLDGFFGTRKVVNTNYEYDPALNRWTIKPSMPTSRNGFAAVAYENSIYCIGGGSDTILTAAVEVFNLSTNKWESKTAMPVKMSDIATLVYDGNIYCIGRWTNEVYNIATDTWQIKEPVPFETMITTNVVNGKLYLTSDSLMYVYNPATDSWVTKPSVQTKYGTVSAVIDNKIYFISANLTQIYDTETDTVSLGAPPGYIGGIALATTGEMAPERIYIWGGELQVYDPEADSWTIGAEIPTNRDSIGFALVNDKIYAIGGNTATSSPSTRDIPFPGLYPTISVTQLAANEEYTPFGYGIAPPKVFVVSPENQNYNVSSLSLVFTVNRPVVWMGYSLDGRESATIKGNTTLSGLSNGLHNLTVYASDEFENTGASETISFNVDAPFPIATIAIASVAIVAVVGVGLLFYFKKRRVKSGGNS